MKNIILAEKSIKNGLTGRGFIIVMKNLWEQANDKYYKMYVNEVLPKIEEHHKKYVEDVLVQVKMRAEKFAEKKWKTDKKRNEYITSELEKNKKILENHKHSEFRPLGFADFKVNPGMNYISDDCVLSKFDDEELMRCYHKINNNKYFLGATKISIGYSVSGSNMYGLCYTRPQIILTLPEDLEKEWKDAEEMLSKSINEFYKDCKYFGD